MRARYVRWITACATGAATGACVLAAACAGATTAAAGMGTLAVHLTDAPFSTDSVSRVDVYVVRIDARQRAADSTEAAKGADGDSAHADGWTTVASPNKKIELLALRNGATALLG